MKERFLHFGVVKASIGLLMLFLPALLMAGQPVKTDNKKVDGSRYESVRANQVTGEVNPLDVQKAFQQAETMRTKSATGAMNLNWMPAGPDNFSGMIWSVIYDNTDPTGVTLIAGAGAGGIWRSINHGLTWTQMAVANNEVPKISSLVQTSSGVIYAASGLTSCKTARFIGTGVYRSDATGQFTVIPSTVTNPDFSTVAKLAINKQTGRIFAATNGGIYYSDNGDNWTKVKSGYSMDVCVSPDGRVLAAVGDSAYMSDGQNLNVWANLTTGETGKLPKSNVGWINFAAAPSDANIFYASIAATDGKLNGIYTSIDAGATWALVFPSNPLFEPFNGYGCYSNTMIVFPNDPFKLYLGGVNMWYGQRIQSTGFFNWEQVSFGNISTASPFFAPNYHHCYAFRPTTGAHLAMASDGGVTVGTQDGESLLYQTSNKDLQTTQFNALTVSSKSSYVMGGGDRIGTLAMGYFYPSQVNYPSDGYQMYRTDASFQPANFGGNGSTCAWSKLDPRIAVFTKFKGAPAIRRADLNDINYINDFMNGVDTINSTYVPMDLWESFTFAQTRDSVKVYARVNTIPADTVLSVESANNKLLFPYRTTAPILKGDSLMVADPIASRFFYYGNGSTVIYPGYGKGIYMTKDMLKFNVDPEYFLIYKDASADQISVIRVSDDLNVLWAGTKGGRLIRITGLINAWDSATANILSSQCVLADSVFTNLPFAGRTVTSISINPKNTNQVLVTLGNYGNQDYVYYSGNANDPVPTFVSVQSNLPKAPVFSSLIELQGNSAIVGTDVGVYSTTGLNTGNPQWAADMNNIGNVPVTDIKQQTMYDFHILNYGMIYIATYGRGIWMDTTYYSPVGIDPVAVESKAGTINLTPNPARQQVTVTTQLTVSTQVQVTVFDLTGRTVLSKDFGTQQKGSFSAKLDISSLPSGSYIVRSGSASAKLIKY